MLEGRGRLQQTGVLMGASPAPLLPHFDLAHFFSTDLNHILKSRGKGKATLLPCSGRHRSAGFSTVRHFFFIAKFEAIKQSFFLFTFF